MSDSRIYDAINLFKYSPTGTGHSVITGDATYRRKFRRLADRTLSKLWELWAADEIGFDDLGRYVGDSHPCRFWTHNIRVNTTIEPPTSAAAYATPDGQGKLAATSCNIVHEAVHLAHDIESYPEEEHLCRTLQILYFHDLLSARSYQSRVTGGTCTASFLPTTPYYADYRNRWNRHLSRDLIDQLLSIEDYRRDLESDETASFIVRSLNWWGGLSNRWPSTRGYYLRSLASQFGDYAWTILRILESLSRQQWQAAKRCAGSMDDILSALRREHHIHGVEFPERVRNVQQRLGVDLGMVVSRR